METFGYGPGAHENGWRREVMEALAWLARLRRMRYGRRPGPRSWENGHNILRTMARRLGMEEIDTRSADDFTALLQRLRDDGEPASQREMVRCVARTRQGSTGAVRRRLEAEDMRTRLIKRGDLPKETPALTATLVMRVYQWTGGEAIRLELDDEPLAILERLANNKEWWR